MENELFQKLKENRELLNKIYVSVEKTRRYFLWVLIVSVVVFVLPLIGLFFAIPSFLDTYTSLDGLL
ncbi:hypothetical protein IID27_00080 [Patescibacteria group bacterium]|nr:hypothetical protein [Patescibacteria group bacterium]